MAIIYVSKDGNDSDDGSTWALAKLTIQAALTAAATGDTVKVGPGVYYEALALSKSGNFTLTLQGDGYVVLDGNSALATGMSWTQTGAIGANIFVCNVNDIIVKGFTTQNVLETCTSAAYLQVVMSRCVAYGSPIGVNVAAGGKNAPIFYDCLFYDCSSYGIYFVGDLNGTPGATIDRCTFADCGAGIHRASTAVVTLLQRCLFAFNTYHLNWVSATGTYAVDDNAYYFDGSAACRLVATNYTTLATWQAAFVKDTYSLDANPQFLDREHDNYVPHIESGVFDLVRAAYAGYARGGVAMSENDPDGNYANKILSNTEDDGSGRIKLSSGTNGYVRTEVTDFGFSRIIKRINIITTLGYAHYPTDVPDYGAADVEPKRMTFRYRISDSAFIDTDPTPAWVEVEPSARGELLDVTGRYLQVEVTLRNDGV